MRGHLLLYSVLLSLPVAKASTQPKALARAQHVLGNRSTPLLHVDGLDFKDLNRNGRLEPYEDWRLSPEERTADLVQRMSLEDLAGVMVHATLPSFGPLGELGAGGAYDLEGARRLIVQKRVNSFITRIKCAAANFAAQNNSVQEIAEHTTWGVPVIISSDPRHHFEQVLGAGVQDPSFSMWPGPLGLAALNDPVLTRRFGNVVRQEYMAVGIRESLAPQADLATEPRWARVNGTFGEDPSIAERMVKAYVEGVQNGATGLNEESVIAVVKHWAGYGAAKDGWDSHSFYGRYAAFPANNFAQHLLPFSGAFEAQVASVMPTYSILQKVALQGTPLEQVGAGFNHQLLTDLLRGQYHFRGVILSDWGITNDCNASCESGIKAGGKFSLADIGMPWGVEGLTKAQRFAKAVNAGVDQIGGTEDVAVILEDVHQGAISESRVREAAARVLLQKFQLGLFEQPYVHEGSAAQVAGNATFKREGEEAQGRAAVLLKNGAVGSFGKPLLPVNPLGKKVYLFGVDAHAAEAAGFTVVARPTEADLAIVRASPPFQSEHPGFFFGAHQHEGRLAFLETDPAFSIMKKVGGEIPIVFVTTLERPSLLANVLPRATAVLGDFGMADDPLLSVITGKTSPQGRLPFELPSSTEAVNEQKSDLPHDSTAPLFPLGFGLAYATPLPHK